MRKTLLVITGLAGTEKARLTVGMAQALQATDQRVTILDHSENNPMHPLATLTITRVIHDLPGAISTALRTDNAIVLLNAAESLHPETLYRLVYDGIDRMTSHSVDVRILALVDDRTCDCFPHLRALLEDHADLTLRYPFAIEEALAVL